MPAGICRKSGACTISHLGGYPNTAGLPSIKYRLTDSFAVPSGVDQHYTEILVWFHDSFLCYRPDESAPEVTELPYMVVNI